MRNAISQLYPFLRAERGVSAIEYAALIGIVVVVVIGGLTAFGTNITAALNAISAQITPGLVGGTTPP